MQKGDAREGKEAEAGELEEERIRPRSIERVRALVPAQVGRPAVVVGMGAVAEVAGR